MNPCLRTVQILTLLFLGFFSDDCLLSQELTQDHRDQFANCRELQKQGNWREARNLASTLVSTFQNAPASQYRLAFTNELANLDQRLGNYLEASQGYGDCLDLAEAISGPETKLASQLKNNLAALKQVTGDFEESEQLNREALSIREKIEGKDTIGTVPAMNNLAGLLWCIGDLNGAETLYRSALTIRQRLLGSEELDTARSSANLGGLLYYQDKMEEASRLVRDAAEIFLAQAGPAHPETLDVLLFLGEVERAAGNPAKARELYLQVFNERIEAFGSAPHVETAEALRRIGDAERELGNYEEAIVAYEKSDDGYAKLLHSNHPDRLEGLFGAGLAALASEQRDLALEKAGAASTIEFANLKAVLQFTDERQRLAYQNLFQSQHLFANLGEAEAIAEFLLRRKGVVVDSLIAEARLMRRADSPEIENAIEILASARARFRSSYLGGIDSGMTTDEAGTAAREAYRNLLQLTGVSAHSYDPDALQLSDLQSSLAAGELLIDFLPFDRYHGQASFEARYGAAIVSHDSVAFVDCSDAETIDALIAQVVPFFEGLGQLDDESAKTILRSLHKELVEPLLSNVEGTSTLFVCPDGPLNFVPFGCLVNQSGKFLIEDFDISYLSAARELIRPSTANEKGKGALLVGNPGFALGEPILPPNTLHRGFLTGISAAGLSLVAESLTPLAGAQAKVAEISRILENNNHRTRVVIGETATEQLLKTEVDSPLFLHLATHGVYLPSLSPPPDKTRTDSSFIPDEVAGFQNPLFGSWLALSGSRDTVDAWSRGVVPDPSRDGILMANEAAELNLEGTQLVTLSACDTASGESTNGDGVLGIRRGFRMAGAENILTTLWPINDAMTVTIMREFYEGLASMSPAASLSATQRKWLVKIRDEPNAVQLPTTDGGSAPVGGFTWAINLAGPFLLSR